MAHLLALELGRRLDHDHARVARAQEPDQLLQAYAGSRGFGLRERDREREIEGEGARGGGGEARAQEPDQLLQACLRRDIGPFKS